MEDGCKLCGRRRAEGSVYCPYHQRSYSVLREAFESWRRALDIDWPGFLREVSENAATGEWAREVAESLLQEGLP